jgi:glucose/arabinose dehydrogenase
MSLLLALNTHAQADPGPTNIPLGVQTYVFGAIPQTVQVVQSPTDAGVFYSVQKTGSVSVTINQVVQSTPLVSFPTSVASPGLSVRVESGGESGLLSMAFDPNFSTNGFVYFFLTGGLVGETATYANVIRYRMTGPTTLDRSSAFRVLSFSRNAGIHNGGWMGFGPDGFLYISVGDAGQGSNATNLGVHHGKMLRIDVTRDDFPSDPLRNFGVPPGNPYVNTAGALPEIIAVGLRNPWRCSFDRATGDLWIGDVGAATAGAIYTLRAGGTLPANFGWPCYDRGLTQAQTNPSTCTDLGALSPALLTYSRNYGGSVTGGYVYRGCAMPLMRGRYIFADYVSGAVTSAKVNVDGTLSDAQAHRPQFGNQGPTGISCLLEDRSGELYLVSLGRGDITRLFAPAPWGRDLEANGTIDSCQSAYCGVADVAQLGGAIGPDGQLTADDLTGYLSAFFAGNLLVADLSRVGGFMQADGQVTSDDLIAFLGQFFVGCP